MLNVILLDNGEPGVVKYTYEDLQRELVSIPDSQILVTGDPISAIESLDKGYVCMVEPDCLVSKRYFAFMLNHLKKHSSRNITMLTAITAIERWDNRMYGYTYEMQHFGGDLYPVIAPQRSFVSHAPYPIQIGYLPGAVVRLKELRSAIDKYGIDSSDWVKTSANISLDIWQNKGRIYLHPKAIYATTEFYVGLNCDYNFLEKSVISLFTRQMI